MSFLYIIQIGVYFVKNEAIIQKVKNHLLNKHLNIKKMYDNSIAFFINGSIHKAVTSLSQFSPKLLIKHFLRASCSTSHSCWVLRAARMLKY